MAADTARLVLPLTHDGGHQLRAQVQHVAGGGSGATLEIVADGVPLGDRALQQGWHAYSWDLPSHLDGPRIVEIALTAKGTRPATSSAPGAVAAAKQLIAGVAGRPPAEVADLTAETIAAHRVSPEGQAGMQAFLEKRRAPWLADGD